MLYLLQLDDDFVSLHQDLAFAWHDVLVEVVLQQPVALAIEILHPDKRRHVQTKKNTATAAAAAASDMSNQVNHEERLKTWLQIRAQSIGYSSSNASFTSHPAIGRPQKATIIVTRVNLSAEEKGKVTEQRGGYLGSRKQARRTDHVLLT